MTPSLRAARRPALATLLLSLALALLGGASTAHAGPADDVCAPMQEYAEASSARIGFVVLDLTDGSRCSYRSDEVFRTASLYKLIVLAEAHEQVRQGTFSFDESITVRQFRPATEDRAAGVDIFAVSAREGARRMIQVSDNATAEALAARLDWEAVGAAPARLGMPRTIIGGAYTTTAGDIAHFFAELHAGTLVGTEEDATMLEVLRGQLIRDRIPWYLPDDVEIAHKTGRLYTSANDAGIVYAPAGPFVLVLLTESEETWDPGYIAIRDLALIAYEGYSEGQDASGASEVEAPSPTPTPTPSPTASPTPTATATPTPTPTATPPPTATPTPTATPAPSATPTATPAAPIVAAAEGTGSTTLAARTTTETWEPSAAAAGGVAALFAVLATFALLALGLGRRPAPDDEAE